MNKLKHEDISILVAEDSPTQAEEIRFFLEKNNFIVTICKDGQEAFERLQDAEENPDIIISDVMMPNMNGYEFCKAVRGNDRFENIPFILLTSLSEPHDIIKSIEAGADKFLTKPFDHKRLVDTISEVYINKKSRTKSGIEMGIKLVFKGNDFMISADKVQLLDLLLSSYEDAYYKNSQLQEARSKLEEFNAELEEKIQDRTKELNLKEKQFRTLAENSPDLIVRFDKNLNIVYLNKSVEKTLGMPAVEIMDRNLIELERQITDCPCQSIVKELFNSGDETHRIFKIELPDGTKWLDALFVPEYDNEGVIEYVLKVSRDITQEKKDQELLHLKNQAIETAINGIVLVDLDEKINYVNKSFLNMWGYKTYEELLGKNITSSLLEDGDETSKALEELKDNGKWIGELKAKNRNGDIFYVEAVANSVTDKDKAVQSYIFFFVDITQNKQIQAELKNKDEIMLAQSKQAAMGDMIAMIAHQWRQPITIIGMIANNLVLDIMLENEITNESLQNFADEIIKETEHLSKTIDDFRNFFKPNKEKEANSLGDVLDRTLQIIGKSLENNNVKIEIIDNSSSKPMIFVNELVQVFLNIINNAKDALKLRNKSDSSIKIEIKESDGYGVVCFLDNAGGIPESAMKRLGEPYFSTKEENGTGLGIYMSKTIVEKHHRGTLSWHNEADGACFEVKIPL